MTKAAFWQRGEALDYKNDTDATIEANTVITIGSHIGIAGMDILPGEIGSLHVEGVFQMAKKASEALTMGTPAYFADDAITATEGDVVAGYAAADAAASDETCLVKIG